MQNVDCHIAINQGLVKVKMQAKKLHHSKRIVRQAHDNEKVGIFTHVIVKSLLGLTNASVQSYYSLYHLLAFTHYPTSAFELVRLIPLRKD